MSFPASRQIGEVSPNVPRNSLQGTVLWDHDPVCQAIQEIAAVRHHQPAPANSNRTSSRIVADWMSRLLAGSSRTRKWGC